jgi:hypothetical protein
VDFARAHEQRAALATFEAMGATFETARTHVDLGRPAPGGARADARAPSAARRIFEASHAPRRTAEVVDLAGALGITLGAGDS